MARYRIDASKTRLVVLAKSSVHDTETRWQGITGSVETSLDELEATRGEIDVDMTTADAGDWLKNRKLKKDMKFDEHPRARFTIDSLQKVEREGERVTASVLGRLSWRGKEVQIEATGSGTIGAATLSASGRFDLDVTKLGVKPPKVLMFKVEDIVECRIELHATAE